VLALLPGRNRQHAWLTDNIMDYLIGYGSLLSQYSRRHHSNIHVPVASVSVTGWARGWYATYADEGATYAGAVMDLDAQFDAVLIPTTINAGITDRERGYRFTQLAADSIKLSDAGDINLSEQDAIWICETVDAQRPTEHAPLPQSYVDTCISGCIEAHGVDRATRFIQQTFGWDCVWVNDRDRKSTPIYPRLSPVTVQQTELIDFLLEQEGVLKYRLATATS